MWLAQREHTRHELQAKLQRWVKAVGVRPSSDAAASVPVDERVRDQAAPSAADIGPLLDQLEADGHLSDRRFVESRVHARSARFGLRRIEQELQRHGTALDDDARATLRASEAARARQLWAAKYGRPAVDLAERLRQMRFLAGRGFSTDVIRQTVAGDERPSPDDVDTKPALHQGLRRRSMLK
jgi:regulatory protein